MSHAGTFRYTALDAEGKKTRGSIAAASEHAAYRQLTDDGLTPIKLDEAGTARTKRGRIRPEDIAGLTRELNVLVDAKIPLASGLGSIAENEQNAALSGVVREIAGDIEAGRKMTDAFGAHRTLFGDVYIETLRAAEQSGSLGSVTHHLAEMLERNMEMSKQIRRAMSYPLIVLGFVFLALTVIVVFVVPKFAVIFETNGVDLPITTQVVKLIGDSVKAYWYIYSGVLLLFLGTAISVWRSTEGRLWYERMFLRLPYAGKMFVVVTAARFSRVLSITIGAGLDLTEAIEIAGRASGRPLFAQEARLMADQMRSGATLRDVLEHSVYLPGFAKRLLSAGKDATELSSSSVVIANHYDREADNLAKNVNTIIEPLMTIALAGIVLLVALSVFLPMWKMIKVGQG